jgi:hypothetical protein
MLTVNCASVCRSIIALIRHLSSTSIANKKATLIGGFFILKSEKS